MFQQGETSSSINVKPCMKNIHVTDQDTCSAAEAISRTGKEESIKEWDSEEALSIGKTDLSNRHRSTSSLKMKTPSGRPIEVRLFRVKKTLGTVCL